MPPGRKDEMSFQESIGSAEFVENLFGGHHLGNGH
jgi:hypothetical protein